MARRRQQGNGVAEDFMGLISRLPWWAGVALAVVSYLFFHWLAKPGPVVPSMQPGQLQGAIYRSMVVGIATAAQYFVPILCLGAAIVSAIGRRQRSTLVTDVAQGSAPDALDGMTWQQFELLVGEAFRLQGYAVTETGGGGADGGVDLVLRKGTEKFLVQCKQWKAFKVSVQPVRELYGLMAAKGASGGFMVTSGRYTEDATAFASGRNLTLIDGPKLFGLIQQAKASTGGNVSSEAPPTARPGMSPPSAPVSGGAAPICPLCSRGMVLRTAKRGANAGGAFWGCSGYPGCKGTRPAQAS